jgi:hypothetical protein
MDSGTIANGDEWLCQSLVVSPAKGRQRQAHNMTISRTDPLTLMMGCGFNFTLISSKAEILFTQFFKAILDSSDGPGGLTPKVPDSMNLQ